MQYGTFTELAEIIGNVLSIDPGAVTLELTADRVESWDSLNHLRLITAVEDHFALRFSMSEVLGFQNVGDLATTVAARRNRV